MLFSCCNLGKCDVGRWIRGIEGKGNGFFEMVRRVVLGNVIVDDIEVCVNVFLISV